MTQSAKENFDLVKEQWVTEAVRLRTDVDKCVKPTDFLVESEKKVKKEGDAAKALMKTSPVNYNSLSNVRIVTTWDDFSGPLTAN